MMEADPDFLMGRVFCLVSEIVSKMSLAGC